MNIRHSTTELDTGACGHYPEWGKVEVQRRNRVIRNIRRLAMITATDKSTSATQEQTQRINQQTSRMDDLCDSHREVCMKLDKLIEIQTKAAK